MIQVKDGAWAAAAVLAAPLVLLMGMIRAVFGLGRSEKGSVALMALPSTPDRRLFAPAVARNREPILAVLRPWLPPEGLVLGVASMPGVPEETTIASRIEDRAERHNRGFASPIRGDMIKSCAGRLRHAARTPAPGEGACLFMYRVLSVLCVLLAVGTLVYQIVTWQTTGHWPDFSVGGGLSRIGVEVPDLTWSGSSRVLATLFRLPLVLCLLVLGLVIELTWGRRVR